MRLFLLDWFGWSFLWILPLLGRVLLSLLSGKGLRGRGSIRIWLGTLAILCASSAIEAMLRSQGDTALETDLFGQALARNVTLAFGKLIAVIALMATGLIGLFWLFGRRKAKVDLDADAGSLPLQASVPRRTQANIAPTIRNLPAAQSHRSPSAQPKPPATPAFGNLTRKRDPWPLPNEMLRAANPSHTPTGNWPGASQKKRAAQTPGASCLRMGRIRVAAPDAGDAGAFGFRPASGNSAPWRRTQADTGHQHHQQTEDHAHRR